MPLPIPSLDTKNFDHFFEESKAVLPSLSPNWTDYNLSDPGITLLELFSWLSDINMYKLNRVDKKHLLNYLKLLGIKPRSVIPAKIWVSFKYKEDQVDIKEGTKIEIPSKDINRPIPFVTKEKITTYNNSLSEISLKNERGYIKYEDANFPIFFYPFGEVTKEGNYFEISFEKTFVGSLSLTFILYEKDLPPLPQSDNGEFDLKPSAILKWSNAEIIRDETDTFSKDGTIYFQNMDSNCNKIRCEITSGRFENAPRINKILLNTTQAVQIETFDKRSIGTGLPNQQISLKNSPIYSFDTLSIDNKPWNQSDTLEVHNHKETVYKVDQSRGIITFGDGVYGKIPPLNSVIDYTYTTSRGEVENITHYIKYKNKDESNNMKIEIENVFSAQSGKNPQTIKEAFLEFQKDLQIPFQAVTAKDYEYLAIHTPNIRVARALAIPPKNSENSIDVVVVPFSLQDKPIPTENFLKTVCMYLNKHRLITTKVNAIAPQYVSISITVEIKLKTSVLENEAKESIQNTLSNFFHPLRGWKDKKGWPFGQAIYQSDIYAMLEDNKSIDCVHYLNIHAEGAFKQYKNGNVILKKDALTLSHQHTISFINIQKECRSST
jgi:hypothetical protein